MYAVMGIKDFYTFLLFLFFFIFIFVQSNKRLFLAMANRKMPCMLMISQLGPAYVSWRLWGEQIAVHGA
jgi:hypothetical protein